MDCGVQSAAMLSVPPAVTEPPAPPTQQQTLATNAVFAPPDTDQAQFEADKRAVYKFVVCNCFCLLKLLLCRYLGIRYFHFWRYYLNDANWRRNHRIHNRVTHSIWIYRRLCNIRSGIGNRFWQMNRKLTDWLVFLLFVN